MGAKAKRPQPVGGKLIAQPTKDTPGESSDSDPPAFCFKHLHRDYGIEHLTDAQKVMLVDKLDKLAKRQWAQIRQEWRCSNGSEIIERSSIRRVQIPGEVTEDVKIVAFHLPSKFRMMGWRRDRYFHVFCLDPKGQLYKH